MPQRRPLAPIGHLQHLSKELDFADAATPQLDVAIAIAFVAEPIHPLLIAMHLLERGMVEVLAVDEGLNQVEKAPAQAPIAGHRARLDEREALERLAPRLVVLRALGQRVRHVAARAHRPEAQVHAIEIALLRVLAERRRQPPGEAMKQIVGAGIAPIGGVRHIGVIHINEIDVRAVVQLASPELAHADHGEPSRQAHDLLLPRELARDDAERAIDHEARESGQVRRGRFERVSAQDVARGDPEDLAPLQPPERVERQPAGGPAGGRVGFRRRAERGRLRVVEARDQPMKILGVPDQQLAEERRGAEQVGQHLQRGGVFAEVAEEARPGGARRKIPREADQRGVRVRGAQERVEKQGGDRAERLANDQIVRQAPEVPLGRDRVPKAERGEILRGPLFGQVS